MIRNVSSVLNNFKSQVNDILNVRTETRSRACEAEGSALTKNDSSQPIPINTPLPPLFPALININLFRTSVKINRFFGVLQTLKHRNGVTCNLTPLCPLNEHIVVVTPQGEQASITRPAVSLLWSCIILKVNYWNTPDEHRELLYDLLRRTLLISTLKRYGSAFCGVLICDSPPVRSRNNLVPG